MDKKRKDKGKLELLRKYWGIPWFLPLLSLYLAGHLLQKAGSSLWSQVWGTRPTAWEVGAQVKGAEPVGT